MLMVGPEVSVHVVALAEAASPTFAPQAETSPTLSSARLAIPIVKAPGRVESVSVSRREPRVRGGVGDRNEKCNAEVLPKTPAHR